MSVATLPVRARAEEIAQRLAAPGATRVPCGKITMGRFRSAAACAARSMPRIAAAPALRSTGIMRAFTEYQP